MADNFDLERRKGPKPETLMQLPYGQLTQYGPDKIDAGWGEDHYFVAQGILPKGLMLVFCHATIRSWRSYSALS